MEPENHGPGRKIAISDTKPNKMEVDAAFTFFMPPKKLFNEYREKQLEGQSGASEHFTSGYTEQLEGFFKDAKKNADKASVEVTDMLPFQDGDTLLTWEKKGNTSYRAMLADYLRDLGYEVEEN